MTVRPFENGQEDPVASWKRERFSPIALTHSRMRVRLPSRLPACLQALPRESLRPTGPASPWTGWAAPRQC